MAACHDVPLVLLVPDVVLVLRQCSRENNEREPRSGCSYQDAVLNPEQSSGMSQ